MYLGYHGGKCCGIKTIWHLGTKPEHEVTPVSKKEDKSLDQCGDDVQSDYPFFFRAAPEESAVNRLDRYIKFLKEKRPSGLVEIALAESQYNWVDQSAWFPVLEERGFKQVVRFKNSNSGNWVRVFYLVIEDGEVKKEW